MEDRNNLKGFTDKELFIELKKRIEGQYKMNLTGFVFDGDKHYKIDPKLECPLNKQSETELKDLDLIMKIRELMTKADREYWFAIYGIMMKLPCGCVDPKKNPNFMTHPGAEIKACSFCSERIKEFERVWAKLMKVLELKTINPITGEKNY